MNRIDELIKKLCPNGVEYRPIWSLTAWDKKFNGVDKEKQKNVISYKYYLSTDFAKVEKKNGNIKYISTGISGDDRYTTEELAGDYLAEGEIVCIPGGGTPNVKYHKGKFVTGDNRIATSLDINILSNKFLYYWMQSKINVISKFYRGSGIKHPSMKDVLDMNIAVPPLEVQCEIVHILDDFTLLSALLSAELKVRQMQYEYYRNRLIKETNKVECKNLTLEDILKIKNGKDYKHLKKGEYPVYGTGGVMTYVDDFVYDKPSVLIPRKGSLDKIYYVEEPFWNVDTIFYTEIKENEVIPKYVYYYLQNEHLEKLNIAGGIPSLTQATLNKVKITIPSKDIQKRVVEVLDNFDKICNSLMDGLPAEIEARQKQYEYYRDKLLTFKELKVNE